MDVLITILVILAIVLGFYLLHKWLTKQLKCPKCGGRMAEVHGWPKVECSDCGHTENY